jgi:hypothetical protein
VIGSDLHFPFLDLVFESSHYRDLNFPRWNCDHRFAACMEVVRFKWPLGANEAVVGVHPRIIRRVSPSIERGKKNAR